MPVRLLQKSYDKVLIYLVGFIMVFFRIHARFNLKKKQEDVTKI